MTADELNALVAVTQQGEDLLADGQYAAALKHYRQALAQIPTAEQKGNPVAPPESVRAIERLAVDRLAELAVMMGQAEVADGLLADLAERCAQTGQRYHADYATVRRIEAALEDGRLRDAYALLQALAPSIGDVTAITFSASGLAQWEAGCSWPQVTRADRVVLFARLYYVMGRLLASLGQYGQALAALERGLFLTEQETHPLARQTSVPLQLARAAVLLEQGEVLAARHEAARLEAELLAANSPALLTRWLGLSAKIHFLLGEFGPAKEDFKRVCEVCSQYGPIEAALNATLNLARLQIYLAQTQLAREQLEQIEKQAAKHKLWALEAQADLLRQLADARSHSTADAPPSVFETWRDALPFAFEQPKRGKEPDIDPLNLPPSDNYLAFFEDRALGFQWRLGDGDWDASAALLAQLEEIFGGADSRLIKVRLRALAGLLACYRGEFDRAEAIFSEVRPALEEMDVRPDLLQAQCVLGWCWEKLARPEHEQERLAQANEQLIEGMIATLPPHEQGIIWARWWSWKERRIARRFDELAREREDLAAAPWWQRLRRRWQLLKGIDAALRDIERHKQAVFKRSVVGDQGKPKELAARFWWWRLWQHPRDRVTFSFLVLPDRTLVIRRGWGRLDFCASPAPRSKVRALVQSWQKLMSDYDRLAQRWPEIAHADAHARDIGQAPTPSRNPDPERAAICRQWAEIDCELEKTSHQLTELLRLPEMLSRLPQRVRALTIVPDDSLHGFPFATIRHEGEYLIKRYALTLAFEASGHNSPARGAISRAALAVGVSEGCTVGLPPDNRPIPALPGALQELNHIAHWLEERQLTVYRFDDSTPASPRARKAALLARLPHADLFHIACHGVSQPGAPAQSGLLLLPQPGQPEILSLRELTELNLSGLQHATLSSCWSANQFTLPGRWVIGLPEALWRAGARSILGCLWVVHDEMAIAGMKQFYHYLANYPRDEALQRVQLDCLRQALPDCQVENQASPYYWAGYSLYGNYKPLRL